MIDRYANKMMPRPSVKDDGGRPVSLSCPLCGCHIGTLERRWFAFLSCTECGTSIEVKLPEALQDRG